MIVELPDEFEGPMQAILAQWGGLSMLREMIERCQSMEEDAQIDRLVRDWATIPVAAKGLIVMTLAFGMNVLEAYAAARDPETKQAAS